MTAATYYSTHDLCTRYRCSSRTIFRRMQRPENPFPRPVLQHVGSVNLWEVVHVVGWEDAEKRRVAAAPAAGGG